ncbi:hypothetical protein BLA60_15430 [Actinophytocola xinjiangensis]|uniref:Uncharacterized protein n=1 Tax=Actinophytocola xinjiangensis TaxID=485602 RepID=A0A7Z0WLY7_9PSEU|nr:hypothetical protein BLA60_15430 [Actinophytocola xinjiangensis]
MCAGPLLGAVLNSPLGGNALHGGIVLLVLAAGTALPLFPLAFLWAHLPVVRRLEQLSTFVDQVVSDEC